MDNEIIVIARPHLPLSLAFPTIDIPGNLGGPQEIFTQNNILAAALTEIEEDVNTNEIVVTATKLKGWFNSMMGVGRINLRGPVAISCIGNTNWESIFGSMAKLKFTFTSQDFGPGRAGANLTSDGSTENRVRMNAQQFLAYDALNGGLPFLIAHETAHGLKQMQDFNASQFEIYRQGAGASMTHDEAVANYPSSAQFVETEAIANKIAQDILNAINTNYNFNPTHGYALC